MHACAVFTAMPADLQACAAVGGDLLRSERLRFALQAAQLHATPLFKTFNNNCACRMHARAVSRRCLLICRLAPLLAATY